MCRRMWVIVCVCVWNKWAHLTRQNKAEDRTPVVSDQVNSSKKQWWAKHWTNLYVCVCVEWGGYMCAQVPSTHFEFTRGPNLYSPLQAFMNWRCYNMITHEYMFFPNTVYRDCFLNKYITRHLGDYSLFSENRWKLCLGKGMARWPQATTDNHNPLVCRTMLI